MIVKNSPIVRVIALCNKLALNVDYFYTPLVSIRKTYLFNNI